MVPSSNPQIRLILFSLYSFATKIVIFWFLNFVFLDISTSILYITIAHEIWLHLKEHFCTKKNDPRIFQLQKFISTLSQGQLSVNIYFTHLKALWDELSNYKPLLAYSCGVVHTLNYYVQQEHVLQFLMGLNESFAFACAQILLMELWASFNKTFSLVLQEEQQ